MGRTKGRFVAHVLGGAENKNLPSHRRAVIMKGKNLKGMKGLFLSLWLGAALCLFAQSLSAYTVIDAKATTGSDAVWWVPSSWTDVPNSGVTINLSTTCTVWIGWIGNSELMRGATYSQVGTRLVIDGTVEPYTEHRHYLGVYTDQDPRLTASITCYKELGPGPHTIKIQAFSADGGGWLYPRKLSVIAFKNFLEGIEEESSHGNIPTRSDLSIRPNPTYSIAAIDYQIPYDGWVSLRIFDSSGRLVRSILNGEAYAGSYRTTWDGRDDSGQTVPAGSYFYALEVDGEIHAKKGVVVR